jgi:hypothetical protein
MTSWLSRSSALGVSGASEDTDWLEASNKGFSLPIEEVAINTVLPAKRAKGSRQKPDLSMPKIRPDFVPRSKAGCV